MSEILTGLGPVFVFVAFMGVCWYAYGGKRKAKFDEAANLPFADDEQSEASETQSSTEDELTKERLKEQSTQQKQDK
ncbi:MAG: cbb3-type cytochrome c oxidase subunit 3 [Cellvibrionaceae bacterium]